MTHNPFSLRLELSEQVNGDGSLSDVFGNQNPVEMEIGCGKAKLLITRAQSHPERNFIGVDYAWRYMKIGCQRAEKRGLSNIRFIKADANRVLSEFIVPESVSVFFIYFPDPWPKRRHQKRRLITQSFAELLHSRLTPRGRIEIATDDFAYFIAIRAAFARTETLWRQVKQSVDEPLFVCEAKTNYEMKFLVDGRTLYYLEVLK